MRISDRAFDSDEFTMESSGSRWTIWKLGQSVGRHNATEFRENLLTQIFLFKCIIHSYVFVTVWAFLSKTPFAFGCWRIVYGTLSAHRNCITFYVLIAYLLEWNFGEITNISVPWGLYLLWEYNRKRTAWIAAALCIILCTKLWCLYGFPQTMHIRIIASLHHNLNKQTIQKKKRFGKCTNWNIPTNVRTMYESTSSAQQRLRLNDMSSDGNSYGNYVVPDNNHDSIQWYMYRKAFLFLILLQNAHFCLLVIAFAGGWLMRECQIRALMVMARGLNVNPTKLLS